MDDDTNVRAHRRLVRWVINDDDFGPQEEAEDLKWEEEIRLDATTKG
jgi:hypothetical protein